MKRTLPILIVVALVAAAAGAAAVKRYQDRRLTFPYPATWTAQPGKPIAGHGANLAYVSSRRIGRPCRVVHRRNFTGWACRWPLKRLPRATAIARWDFVSLPGLSVARESGRATRISGRRAKIQIGHSAAGSLCPPLHAQEQINAVVAGRHRGTIFSFVACLRGPGLKALERQVKMILFSTRILKN